MIKKYFTVFISAILFLFSACKKEIKNPEANANFGRVYSIAGNQSLLGSLKTHDGGYLLWGYVDGSAIGTNDGFLLRLDKNFNQLWYKTFGGNNDDFIMSAVEDNEGNILAGGKSYSFGISVDSNSLLPNPLIYAVYTNSSGDIKWEKTFYATPVSSFGNQHNTLSKVLFLPNQTFALVGGSNNYTTQNGGVTYFTPEPYIQIINKQGDTLWNSHYNFFDTLGIQNTNGYYASNALVTADGNIMMLMTSSSRDAKVFPTSLWKIPAVSTTGENKFIWRKPINNIVTYFIGTFPYVYNRFPMQMTDSTGDNYMVCVENSLLFFDRNGNLKNNKQMIFSTDMNVVNDNAWFVLGGNISKTDLNGNEIFTTKIFKDINLNESFGIYLQDNNTVSLFGTYISAKNDKDICMTFIDKNGNLKIK